MKWEEQIYSGIVHKLPMDEIDARLRLVADILGLTVRVAPFRALEAVIYKDTIYLSDKAKKDELPALIAHELGHFLRHRGRGDLIHNPDPAAEIEADDTAKELIRIVTADPERMDLHKAMIAVNALMM